MSRKPLKHKNYGSIPHLPNSRMGLADKSCHEGQARIATEEARDSNDEIIVQEKLDGSNVERDKATGKKGEKKRVVDFLVKYVRPDKEDGIYLPEISGEKSVFNWTPDSE